MKDVKVYLSHIKDECDFIIEVRQNINFEKFVEDEILKRSIVRSLEIIGEAVKNIPTEFKENYPNIPWKLIAGLRDILIHEYFGIDYKNVWKIIEDDVPELRKNIIDILKALK